MQRLLSESINARLQCWVCRVDSVQIVTSARIFSSYGVQVSLAERLNPIQCSSLEAKWKEKLSLARRHLFIEVQTRKVILLASEWNSDLWLAKSKISFYINGARSSGKCCFEWRRQKSTLQDGEVLNTNSVLTFNRNNHLQRSMCMFARKGNVENVHFNLPM